MVSISVALATYNGERFLRRQLETLARQDRAPNELVVCDDCSHDSTPTILHEFSRTAPFPVRIEINTQPLNFRENFVKAANLCKYDVILFCDQDDIWHRRKISVMARAFENEPSLLLAYHAATVVDSQERPIGSMFDSAFEHEILSSDLPPPWHFARGLVQGFRKDLLAFDDLWPATREHFDRERLGHDRWYFFLALAMRRICFIEDNLLMYRQHDTNLFGSDRQYGAIGRVTRRFHHHPSSDLYGAAGARSRAAVLSALKGRVDPKLIPRLSDWERAYSNLADRLARRAITYTATSAPKRARALATSIAKRDYFGNPWGFDPLSVLRDAAVGVLSPTRR